MSEGGGVVVELEGITYTRIRIYVDKRKSESEK